MAQNHLPVAPQRGFGETMRTDAWWIPTLGTFLGLSAFIVYMTWAGLQNQHFAYEGYLSPAYSPLLYVPTGLTEAETAAAASHAWLGLAPPAWWPGAIPFLPAFLILWAPGGFRVTCYYYRGAYYKAFWQSPPNCAVGKPHSTYSGERAFPLIVQNIHRYFMYVAVIFLFILASDVYKGMWFSTASGGKELGIGVGTIVLTLNVVFLSMYTLGCHSLRHVIGGFKDRISGAPLRRQLYKGCTALNRTHMRWAWTSLVWVGFTDVYVRMCAMGIWTDARIV